VKELLQALESRIRSPFMGYFTLAFFVINWKEVFFLLADKGGAAARITYFQSNTDMVSILLYPILVGVVFALAYPWINFFFLYLCQTPTDLRNGLQANSEHKLLLKKQELEEVRSAILSNAERELIDRAKRDEELNKIEDEDTKNKLKSEIDALRKEKEVENNPKYENPEQLLEMANKYREMSTKVSSGSDDQNSLKIKARALEEKAHEIMMRKKSNA
jgi:hypothetical protein